MGIWGTIFNAEILQNIFNFYPDRQFIGIEVRDGTERAIEHIAMYLMDGWSERLWSGGFVALRMFVAVRVEYLDARRASTFGHTKLTCAPSHPELGS